MNKKLNRLPRSVYGLLVLGLLGLLGGGLTPRPALAAPGGGPPRQEVPTPTPTATPPPPAEAATPTPTATPARGQIVVAPEDLPLVITGTLDTGATVAGTLRLWATGAAVPRFLAVPSNLYRLDEANAPPVARSHVQLGGTLALPDTTPQDFALQISGLEQPGTYSGTLTLLQPGQVLTEGITIPLRITARRAPNLVPLPGSDQLTLRLVHCEPAWVSLGPWSLDPDCWLAGILLPPAARMTTRELEFENPTGAPVSVTLGLPEGVGARTQTLLPTAAFAIAPTTLAASRVVTLPLSLNRVVMQPDQYHGSLYLLLAGRDAPLKVPLDLAVRRGPLWALIFILLGILLGRLVLYMNTIGYRLLAVGSRRHRLEKRLASLDPRYIELLRPLLNEATNALNGNDLGKVETWLRDIELRADLLTNLDNAEAVFQRRGGTADVRETIRTQIDQIRTDLGQLGDQNRVAAESLFPPLFAAINKLPVPPPAGGREVGRTGTEQPLVARGRIVETWGTRLRTMYTRVAQPVLYVALVVGLTVVGLKTLYADAEHITFGADPFDYLALVLWGLSSEITGRTLSNLTGTPLAGGNPNGEDGNVNSAGGGAPPPSDPPGGAEVPMNGPKRPAGPALADPAPVAPAPVAPTPVVPAPAGPVPAPGRPVPAAPTDLPDDIPLAVQPASSINDRQEAGPRPVPALQGGPHMATYHALLIGIDDYPQTPLHGCVNDINEIEKLLAAQYPAGNAEATLRIIRLAAGVPSPVGRSTEPPCRATILEKFRELADPTVVGAGDRVLIYYSGHGSQQMDAHNHIYEALVAVDPQPIYDVEVNAWLGAIADNLQQANPGLPGADLTVVLDCCHAAGATREAMAPTERYWSQPFVDPPTPILPGTARDRGVGDGGLLRGLDPTFLAVLACQADQRAGEGQLQGQANGYLTRALLDMVQPLGQDHARLSTTRWSDIWPGICDGVYGYAAAARKVQHPTYLGRTERWVLGGTWEKYDGGFIIHQDTTDPTLYHIATGSLLGVTKDALLGVYDAATVLFPPVGTAEDVTTLQGRLLTVETADRMQCTARATTAFAIEPGMRARLLKVGAPERLRVAVADTGMSPDADLTQWLDSGFITVTRVDPAQPPAVVADGAAGEVLVMGNVQAGWTICNEINGLGDPYVARVAPLADARWQGAGTAIPPATLQREALQRGLKAYYDYNKVLRMARRCNGPAILTVQLCQVEPADQFAGLQLPHTEWTDRVLALPTFAQTAGLCQVPAGAHFVLRLSHSYTSELRFWLFDCSADGGAYFLGQTGVAPNSTEVAWQGGYSGKSFHALLGPNRTAQRDRLVIIATTSPVLVDQLLQIPPARYVQTIQEAIDRLDKGMLDFADPGTVDIWTSLIINLDIG